MSDERATVRPVTLGRLVEVTHACEQDAQTTDDIEQVLDVSHRRARETILEALRIDLIEESTEHQDSEEYCTTTIGEGFIAAVKNEAWQSVSSILAVRSPHYKAFLDTVSECESATLSELLDALEERAEFTPYTYNQASIELLGDWAERLGVVQRNAFTGDYYRVEEDSIPPNFQYVVLSVYDDLEETAGVNLRQRHLSIPELREYICQQLGCSRGTFDDALLQLTTQNVGKLELSGAPLDTKAKESPRGVRKIELTEGDSLVSTSQTTDRVMAGVEQYGKQYYYLAVYDRDLEFTKSETNNE